jgi:putative oxidoreductase
VNSELSHSKNTDRILLLARVLMASLFVFSGTEGIFRYWDAVAFATSFGVPWAGALFWIVILFELSAGAMLITGCYARVAAGGLFAWVMWTGPWFHRFWQWHVGQPMWQDMVDGFFHHYVMAGGFLYIVALGPGRLVLFSRAKP